MEFISTRNTAKKVSGTEAVVEGLSCEGGLFVPAFFPEISADELKSMSDTEYCERAALIIGKFLPELKDSLNEFTAKAYGRFDGDAAPLVKIDDSLFVLELWHGPDARV